MFGNRFPADLVLRRAEPSDTERVVELVAQVLGEFDLHLELDGPDADLLEIESHYHLRGGIFDLLVRGDEIVATVAIDAMENDRCELRRMYLSRDLRGRGLGKHLLDHALAAAREAGFREVILETNQVLARATALYQKTGFVLFEGDTHSDQSDATYRLELSNSG